MLKLILSIIGGLFLAFAIVFATDAMFHSLVPSSRPPGDPSDAEAMRDYVAGQPYRVLAGLLTGWALAAFAGSAVAAHYGGRGEKPGWVVTALFLLATAANFLIVQHPTWMVVAAIISISAAGWLGSRTFARAGPPHQLIG